MRLTKIMEDRSVLKMPDDYEDYVYHLEGDPYLQDCILLGAADLLRDVAIAPFVEVEDAVVDERGPSVRHLLLSRLSKDCSPLSDSCPHHYGPEEAFTFTGDLIKWRMFGQGTVEGVGRVAQLLADGMDRLRHAGNPGDDWVRQQTAVWTAEILNLDTEVEPAEALERALTDLRFPRRGQGLARA